MSLKTQMEIDTNIFISEDDFGDVATLTKGGSPSIVSTINVVLTEEFRSVNGVENLYPVALAKTSDISGVKHRDTLEVKSVTKYIIGIHPSDDGLMTELILSQD